MNRRDWLTLCTAATAGAWPLAGRAQAPNFVEGQQYQKLQRPVGVSAPAGKIEVVEFFWYGCPHCFAFEPRIEAWVKALPADVAFRRVHVGFRPSFKPLQQLAVSLEVMGLIDTMQQKVFNAIHVERQRLDTAESIIDFVAKNGVDRAKFTQVFNSFGVQSKVQQGTKLAEDYRIDGVPALGIHGRYLTSPSMVGGDRLPEVEGQRLALQLADQLIVRVRKGA
jgi:thiol:disulfide interchange protein DsbA